MSTTPAPIDPPDPEKVTSLIEALDKFIVSMTPVPGQPEPAGAVVLEAIGRLEGLLQEFGEVERWEDTTKLTGASVVAGGIKGARDVLATRLYAPQVSPRERGWLTEHLQDLRRGMEAIGRLGPFGSMDPMHNPSPVLTPDPNLLLAILTDASKWYQWAALRDGQNPRDDDRLSVLNASCQLSDTIARFGNDPRWQTDNRYHRIYFVVNRLALLVLEATRRSYLVRTDDGWILDPPKQDYTKGMDEFDYGNPFLGPEIAREVDLARQDIQQAMLELINLNTSNRQVEPARVVIAIPDQSVSRLEITQNEKDEWFVRVDAILHPVDDDMAKYLEILIKKCDYVSNAEAKKDPSGLLVSHPERILNKIKKLLPTDVIETNSRGSRITSVFQVPRV
jgi:hypothetical protein